MDYVDISLALAVVGTSLVTATLALAVMAQLDAPRRVVWPRDDPAVEPIAFLFEDDDLVDASTPGRALLDEGPQHLDDWPRLAAILRHRFPGLEERLAGVARERRIALPAAEGDGCLTAEWRDGMTRIDISSDAAGGEAGAGLVVDALRREVAELRGILDSAPCPIWRQDAAGAVRWANATYVDMLLRRDPEAETLAWPLPRLFDPAEVPDDTTAPRLTVDLPRDGGESEARIFEVHAGADGACFALPADRLARAEERSREFVQTLAKTFAHLPTGLAVFDRQRRLALFNPALTDLTNLPPLFLSGRPSLFEFLDRLRESQRIPEPKDYREWRRRIVEMENAAANGTHIETWTLPDGQVYRVTGRPHPDGALAFLFQDVTSEVSLTRRFRSELELGQAVVDSLDEAIAVFSPAGALVLSNVAYDSLWQAEPDTVLMPATLREASDTWQAACQPSPVWPEIRRFVGRTDERQPWTADIQLLDGRGLTARVVPLAGNATLVGFRLTVPPAGRGRITSVEEAASADMPGKVRAAGS